MLGEGRGLHRTDGPTDLLTPCAGEEQPSPLIARHHGNACQGLDHLPLYSFGGILKGMSSADPNLLCCDDPQLLATALHFTVPNEQGWGGRGVREPIPGDAISAFWGVNWMV